MSAEAKTKALIRMNLPLPRLQKNDKNPNKMKAKDFDLLADNVDLTGMTDAILCRPLDQPALEKLIKAAKGSTDKLTQAILDSDLIFRIVGGHHRFDVATFQQFETVPVTIIPDKDFDEAAENFQLVRMNMIRGELDPNAFFALYQEMAEEYSDEFMQTAFGFAEEAEFKKLIDQTAKSIEDPVAKKKFKEAAAEIKTIDGLSKLLNEMFTKYGDTLPYGYMVFDHGGKRSVWLRIEGKTMNALDLIAEMCIEQKRTVDDIIGHVLREAAKGKLSEMLQEGIDKSPEVVIPEGFSVSPTKDNLEKVGDI